MPTLVIGNATLADISIKYGLPERLRLHRAQAMTLRTSVHVQAFFLLLLEAYIGGVYSDQGIEATSDWVKLLFRPYVKEAYRIVREQYGLLPDPESPLSPPPSPARTDTEGTYYGTRGNRPSYSFSGLNHDLASTGMACELHRPLITLQSIHWVYETERDNAMKATPMWIVRANIDGRQIAVGRGTTKKSAQNDAAMKSLANLNASGTRE
ncbi:hypothetical protein DFH11DRAFT_1567335 [Phellopilus nigrolimitatus]|nr:hypothetical protein DFH11DRAFT_1567335 [Phellopilus nigrolimitatus]